jgi:hypothetical protein
MSYYTEEFKELQIVLDVLWNYNNYQYVYVSVGGKFNEYEFAMPSPTTVAAADKSIKMRSNAHLQMRPSFLCDRNSNVLIICIDHFRNEVDEKINRDICKGLIQSNMGFIFYNLNITLSSITEFFNYFIPLIESREVLQENFIVCNYIRFMNEPNLDEALLDSNLSETIYKTMASSKYKKSLYQWFGYHPNLYNIIFNYQEYYVLYFAKFSQLVQFLGKKYGETPISVVSASELNEEIEKYPFLTTFMKSAVDIGSYYHGEKMADPLIEWIS